MASRSSFIVALITFLLAGVLLFARLGHYAFWDDESMVGLAAKGILKTGDTTVQLDNNIVAYRNGLLIRNFHDRSTPPLASYVAAGSMAIFGQNAFAGRLPFAIFGLATVGLVLWWALSLKVPLRTLLLLCGAIIGNVSFFLYCRNCRYYGAVMFLSTLVVWLYLRWNKRAWQLAVLSVAMGLLFAANYMSYLALLVCILLDFGIWRRKEVAFKPVDWVALILPQLIIGASIASIWNPLGTKFGSYVGQNSLADRIKLLWWQFRDMDQCEYYVGALLLVAIGLAVVKRDRWLMRALAAFGAYVVLITLVSPQTMSETTVADVRYLVGVIPLCWFIGVRAIEGVSKGNAIVAAGLGVVAFGSNLLHGGPLLSTGLRCTPVLYVQELIDPPLEPYTQVANWINQNVKAGESVWVVPDYCTYPLMFHAPQATYAWQLSGNYDFALQNLPRINFQGRVAPDYIVAFGLVVQQVGGFLRQWNQASYKQVQKIDVLWKDMYRPEIFWRKFRPVTGFNPQTDTIYILKKN